MEQQRTIAGTDDGFHIVGAEIPRVGRGHKMSQAVARDDGMWAVADSASLWHDDGTGDGRIVAAVPTGRANCLVVHGGEVMVGGSDAALYRLDDHHLERVAAFDSAPSRDSWYTPWGGPPDVRSMDVGADGALYLNVHVGGVLRSVDGGGSWQQTIDIDADVHQVVADPHESEVAYAATARGMAVTTDGAATWQFLADGLHATYCRAVTVSNEYVFVSASVGPSGQQACLYRVLRLGGAYERCRDGLPEWFSGNVNTFCLAAADSTVVAGDSNGTIYLSHDDGAHWSTAAADLPGVNSVAIL